MKTNNQITLALLFAVLSVAKAGTIQTVTWLKDDLTGFDVAVDGSCPLDGSIVGLGLPLGYTISPSGLWGVHIALYMSNDPSHLLTVPAGGGGFLGDTRFGGTAEPWGGYGLYSGGAQIRDWSFWKTVGSYQIRIDWANFSDFSTWEYHLHAYINAPAGLNAPVAPQSLAVGVPDGSVGLLLGVVLFGLMLARPR